MHFFYLPRNGRRGRGGGRRHSVVQYREDFNCDRSRDAKAHDMVADSTNVGEAVLRKAGGDLVRELAEGQVPAPRGERKWQPTTTRRELLQRTSARQRQLLKALHLYRSGMSWKQVAGELGISQRDAYHLRDEICSKSGGAALYRGRITVRDENGRFLAPDVGCEEKSENRAKAAKNAS